MPEHPDILPYHAPGRAISALPSGKQANVEVDLPAPPLWIVAAPATLRLIVMTSILVLGLAFLEGAFAVSWKTQAAWFCPVMSVCLAAGIGSARSGGRLFQALRYGGSRSRIVLSDDRLYIFCPLAWGLAAKMWRADDIYGFMLRRRWMTLAGWRLMRMIVDAGPVVPAKTVLDVWMSDPNPAAEIQATVVAAFGLRPDGRRERPRVRGETEGSETF